MAPMRGGRRTRIGRVMLAGMLLVAALAGCGGPGSGDALYASSCATCHGPDRAGIDGLGPALDAGSLALGETDAWLTQRVRNGSGRMPPMGRILTDPQIDLVVAHLRTAAGDGTTTTTPPGEIDDEAVAAGKALFETGKGCIACHGPGAAGTAVAPNIVGVSAPRIAAAVDGGVPAMATIELTPEEAEAIAVYLRSLVEPS
jgi:ubiquinol-cytochrome c reductase cytochrome c subunit